MVPMNNKRTFVFQHDKAEDTIIEGVVQWEKKHGRSKGVKRLMDTGRGHD